MLISDQIKSSSLGNIIPLTCAALAFNIPFHHLNTASYDYLLDTNRAYETVPLCYKLIILLCYFLS